MPDVSSLARPVLYISVVEAVVYFDQLQLLHQFYHI
jgi:hypothetical protein